MRCCTFAGKGNAMTVLCLPMQRRFRDDERERDLCWINFGLQTLVVVVPRAE